MGLIELVRGGRIDLRPLLTHPFSLDEIMKAYRRLQSRAEGVIKDAIRSEPKAPAPKTDEEYWFG